MKKLTLCTVLICIFFITISTSATIGIINKTPAHYPKYAVNNCIEGYVIIEFKLVFEESDSGSEQQKVAPTSIRIYKSSPKDVFDASAIQVMKKWKFTKEQAQKLEKNSENYFIQTITYQLGEVTCTH